MKSIAFLPAAVMALTPAAIAGPYVEFESNQKWSGLDYKGVSLETHLGYEADFNETSGWFIQAGPAFTGKSGEAMTRAWSGKIGADTKLAHNLKAGVEVSGETAGEEFNTDDLGLGVKAKVKYSF